MKTIKHNPGKLSVLIISLISLLWYDGSAQVYISRGNGDSWQPMGEGLPDNARVNTLVLKDALILAGTEAHGLYARDLKGKRWNVSGTGLPRGAGITSLAVHRNRIVAGTKGKGVFLSADNGENWTASSKGMQNMFVRACISRGPVLFAGTNEGIYLSYDDGASWNLSKGGIQVNAFGAYEEKLFVATNKGILYSDDNGTTWTWRMTDTAQQNLTIAGKEIFIIGFNGRVMRSADDGRTWFTAVGVQPTFSIRPFGNVLFASQKQGIVRSTDKGWSWWYSGDGLPAELVFTEMLITPTGIVVAAGRAGC